MKECPANSQAGEQEEVGIVGTKARRTPRSEIASHKAQAIVTMTAGWIRLITLRSAGEGVQPAAYLLVEAPLR